MQTITTKNMSQIVLSPKINTSVHIAADERNDKNVKLEQH
jgi:hypothetical protein